MSFGAHIVQSSYQILNTNYPKMQALKIQLHKLCATYLQSKITQTQKAMEEAQIAANQETKSSAGDKHETGRAMMQLEIEKYSGQLTEWLKVLQELERIDPKRACNSVEVGALVICNNGSYYISIAAGKLSYEGKTYFAVSPASPIGELLIGKTSGTILDFRGQALEIKSVF